MSGQRRLAISYSRFSDPKQAKGDSETRQEIAAKIQERAFETVPYIPTGQYLPKTAYRKNLSGIIIAPALFMWNVEKS